MMRRLTSVLAAVALLPGCATVQRYDAAGDVHALLVAIRDNDRAGFDAHVDRPALKESLKVRITAMALRRGGAAGGVLAQAAAALADPLIEAAIQPRVFLAVAEANGYRPSQPLPNRAVIASAIRPLQDDRACVTTRRGGPCVLILRREADVWRLIAFEGPDELLRLPGLR